MTFLDIFKKKKIEKKIEIKKEKPVERKEVKKRLSANASKILQFPHITEKATDLNKANKYVFKVSPESNKIEIKKAVEGLYGVDVISVNIINVPRKKRRVGKQTGWRKGYKKAIVKIKQGQSIEILPR